jgi:hypothetical protein
MLNEWAGEWEHWGMWLECRSRQRAMQGRDSLRGGNLEERHESRRERAGWAGFWERVFK